MKFSKFKIFLFIPFFVLVIGLVTLAFPLKFAQAQLASPPATTKTTQQRCDDFKKQFVVGSTNVIGNLPTFCSASSVATWAVNLLMGFAGTVAVLFLILGGYFYMASAGNEEQAEKGKKMLIYSVVGLAVIIMAFAIIRIVSALLTAPK